MSCIYDYIIDSVKSHVILKCQKSLFMGLMAWYLYLKNYLGNWGLKT